ncbi:MAG: DUF5667 domain-containing protein [Aggregatilineales bacterium]
MSDNAGHTPELHSIAEKYLAALRRGTSLADCLADCRARHGDAVLAEVRPALEAALLTARLRQPAMPAASVDALELRLRGTMLARRRPAPALTGLARLAAAVAIVMLALLGTGGGAVVASENAVPGEALYPIKRLWEEIVLALAPLTGERDAIWLWIAQRRLDEAETLAARGQLTPQALADLLAAMEQAATLAKPERQPVLRAYLDDVRAALAPVLPPAGAETAYKQVLRRAARPDAAPPAPSAALTLTPTVTASATASPTPSAALTLTPTVTASATASPTATFTPTSRVPATSTATPLPPSPTPTVPPPSLTPSPSASPTNTWTPLPLPASPVFTPLPTATLTATEALPTAPPTNTPEPLATERWRETQAAVYMTQTAQARAPSVPTETP